MLFLKKWLRKELVTVLDEIYGYPGWRHHEHVALEEPLDRNDYDFLCFSNEAVAIEMAPALKYSLRHGPKKSV